MHFRGASLLFFVLMTSAGIAACAGSNFAGGSSGGPLPPTSVQKGVTPISHVVIVIQENRSFDNFFATFPGADGTTSGKAAAMSPSLASTCAAASMPPITKPTNVPLTEVDLLGHGFPGNYGYGWDLSHMSGGFKAEWDQNRMDGFDLVGLGTLGSGIPACTYAYQYVNPADIAPYWDLAKQYVLADHTFQDQGSGSFTAHQDLIAGGTQITPDEALIDTPSYFPWGCDGNPNSEVTAIIKRGGKIYPYGGPFPCLTYTTIRDLLDAKAVSWKFYAEAVYPYTKCPKCNGPGIWSAFDAIKAVRYSPEWKTNVTRNNRQIFSDITANKLPAVAWVTPDGTDSDHLGVGKDTGPSWVASIVNAIGKSPYWDSTAIVIVWDDWGGLYDHLDPPRTRNWQGGPGLRVPMLIVSPYVKPHVDHTVYQFGSILQFIEKNWDLGTLGRGDEHSTSIRNAFDFNMAPRKFTVIPSKYSQDFFLRKKPSGLPPDTE